MVLDGGFEGFYRFRVWGSGFIGFGGLRCVVASRDAGLWGLQL